MNITKDLMDEHQLILSYIRLLKAYVEHSAIDSGDALLEKGSLFVDFIQNFADRFHHAKEEDVLFKHMEKGGALTHCNPLPQMLHEHNEGRAAVQRMVKAVEESDVHAFSIAAVSYAELLEDHIYKEDNILYQMAEAGLDDAQKTATLQEYLMAEEKLDAPAVWNTYILRLQELEGHLSSATVNV